MPARSSDQKGICHPFNLHYKSEVHAFSPLAVCRSKSLSAVGAHYKSEVHTFSLLTAYLFHPPFDYASLPMFYAAAFRTSTGRFPRSFAPTAKDWSHVSERGTLLSAEFDQ
jgi:hypothetical protein